MTDEDTKRNQTRAQVAHIEEEVRATQPLTSDPLPVFELARTYSGQQEGGGDGGDGNSFLLGARCLEGRYGQMRRIRGDGNCYYRAVLYSIAEGINMSSAAETSEAELGRLSAWAKDSLDRVVSQGYDRFAVEMFHEELVDLLDYLKTSPSADGLHARLTEEGGTSDYCTWYLRVITAAHLKADPDRFLPYLGGGHLDVPTFCAREVEPMGRECEMVQALALAEALGVRVVIEYLDGRDLDADGQLFRHTLGPAEAETVVTLLYRPGHYDILY